MAKLDRDTAVQAAMIAVRDSLAGVGHAWMNHRSTETVRGVHRVTLQLEPVWLPITNTTLVRALATYEIRPRTVRTRAGIDLRAIHVPTAVEFDFAIAAKLSKRTEKHLDSTLGRGWRKRRPRST